MLFDPASIPFRELFRANFRGLANREFLHLTELISLGIFQHYSALFGINVFVLLFDNNVCCWPEWSKWPIYKFIYKFVIQTWNMAYFQRFK